MLRGPPKRSMRPNLPRCFGAILQRKGFDESNYFEEVLQIKRLSSLFTKFNLLRLQNNRNLVIIIVDGVVHDHRSTVEAISSVIQTLTK